LTFDEGLLIQTQAKAALAALTQRDSAGFQLALASLLANIPHNIHSPNEGYCHAVFILAMGLAGQRCEAESGSGGGTFDVHLRKADGTDFIIELKYVSRKNRNTGKDLNQDELRKKTLAALQKALNHIVVTKKVELNR
jgi:hypothetical protein